MGVTADGYPWIEDPDQPADMLAWTAEAAGAAQTVLDTHEMAPDPHGVYVRKAGGTMTGPLVLPGDATAALQAVPKQQLDALATDTQAALAKLGVQGGRFDIGIFTPGQLGKFWLTLPKPYKTAPSVVQGVLEASDLGPWTVMVATIAPGAIEWEIKNHSGANQICRIRWMTIGTFA